MAMRLSEVVQGVAVAAERHRVDEASGEQGEGHALEEAPELRRHRGENLTAGDVPAEEGGGVRLTQSHTHPFPAVGSGHAVKHPLVFSLGLQSHLQKELIVS